jgi:mono/diheme cytochrome c family protein
VEIRSNYCCDSAKSASFRIVVGCGKQYSRGKGGKSLVNNRRFAFLLTFFALAIFAGFTPVSSFAQDVHSPAPPQDAKEVTGKKIFYQRCSVCHLTPIRARSTGTKAYGPLLKGFVHDTDSEQAATETIKNGRDTRMPGFQYGLRPEEIDDIVAYLKTYR